MPDKTIGRIKTPNTETVLETLRQRKAMPLLEIAALTGVHNQQVEEIIRELVRTNKVKLSNKNNKTPNSFDLFNTIVTLSAK